MALLAASAPALAAIVSNTDFSGSILNLCNGEAVAYSGTVHVVLHTTTDSAGGQHSTMQVNISATGTGGTTGATYQGHETDLVPSFNFTNGAFEQTVATHFELIGQGQVPNFRIDGIEHITVNANGTVTATFLNLTTACQ
jgi:hypothetical protein